MDKNIVSYIWYNEISSQEVNEFFNVKILNMFCQFVK